MNHKPRPMAEIRRIVVDGGTPTTAQTLSPIEPGLSVVDVNSRLVTGVGDLDLGPFGNLMAKRHQRKEEGQLQRALVTERAAQARALMLEKIHGEAEIIRTAFRQDFSDRIAALAEAAAASQITVLRKLRAIESEARGFVLRDLKRELDELEGLLAEGVVDEEGFKQEAAFRFARYETLKADLTGLLDEYQRTVQSAYRASNR